MARLSTDRSNSPDLSGAYVPTKLFPKPRHGAEAFHVCAAAMGRGRTQESSAPTIAFHRAIHDATRHPIVIKRQEHPAAGRIPPP
ncbi:hypothetical protein ACLOJK_039327 [Asimina triloba]